MKKVLIVCANYYSQISSSLIKSSNQVLKKNRINFKIIYVPGTYEIPFIVSKYIKNYIGCITLGCLIKGKTAHFDLIANSVFDNIIKISISNNKPITNGIITAYNKKQAIQRKEKKGLEAAKALLNILNGPGKR